MNRIFLFNETLVPVRNFDFRVTVLALQAVRGMVIERHGWPDSLPLGEKILAKFLDFPISPMFLPEGYGFTAFENRYESKIKEITGFPSYSKHFEPAGKTFRDFAEHRLGTTLEGALFHSLNDFHTQGKAVIPSLSTPGTTLDLLHLPVTEEDMKGIDKAMDVILNPLVETGYTIVQMNPTTQMEFPNITMLKDLSSTGKSFGDLLTDAMMFSPLAPGRTLGTPVPTEATA